MTSTKIWNILLAALIFAAGYLTHYYIVSSKQLNAREQSQVLLEKIKEVAKLTTVEGSFSEVYNYKDYWGYDFFPFQKKAIILVNAKVAVGYDLQKMQVTSDEATKTIFIQQQSAPEILSLEHDLSYYDISEGTFNNFSAQDYTNLQGKVKDFIREKAEQSEIKQRATLQGNKMITMLRFIVENAGWKLVIQQPTPMKG
jgi:Protein of unknown function (DUF4230)